MDTLKFLINSFVVLLNGFALWNHDWRVIYAFWLGMFISVLMYSINTVQQQIAEKQKDFEAVGLGKNNDETI